VRTLSSLHIQLALMIHGGRLLLLLTAYYVGYVAEATAGLNAKISAWPLDQVIGGAKLMSLKQPESQPEPVSLTSAEELPVGAAVVEAARLRSAAYQFTYTTGPFLLPAQHPLARLGHPQQRPGSADRAHDHVQVPDRLG
jgi:hypothetical protein